MRREAALETKAAFRFPAKRRAEGRRAMSKRPDTVDFGAPADFGAHVFRVEVPAMRTGSGTAPASSPRRSPRLFSMPEGLDDSAGSSASPPPVCPRVRGFGSEKPALFVGLGRATAGLVPVEP